MKRKTGKNNGSTLVIRVCAALVVVLLGSFVSQAATVDLDGVVFTGSSYISLLGTTKVDLTGDAGSEGNDYSGYVEVMGSPRIT